MTKSTFIKQAQQTQQFNEDLYNILMGSIEPDLTTTMLPILDELYLGETEAEHAERMERYAAAIEQFKKRSVEFLHDCSEAILKIKDHAVSLTHDRQAAEDATEVHSLEASIEQS